jgi:hypothetical protein
MHLEENEKLKMKNVGCFITVEMTMSKAGKLAT